VDLNNIKVLLFDFGGVVVDIDRERAVQRFEEIGVEQADSLLNSYKQNGIFLQLEEGILTPGEFYNALCELAGKDIPSERIDYAWMGFFPSVNQDRLNFINELRKKYRVCLLSNTNPIIMEWARSAQFSQEGKPLDTYFDKLYLSYQMGMVKPKHEIFEQILKSENVTPEHIMFFDDGPANIETASAMGFKTQLVEEGQDFRILFNAL
jgi:putative hydrolase of the HAD superfamily